MFETSNITSEMVGSRLFKQFSRITQDMLGQYEVVLQ